MTNGLYAATSAMTVEWLKQDLISHNLANAETPGFKADQLAFQPFLDAMFQINAGHSAEGTASLPLGATVAEQAVDWSRGPLQTTGRDLDLAVEGEGFLVVQAPAGERYLRSASLQRDEQGVLCTTTGWPVLGQAGPIFIGEGSLQVKDQGEVWIDGTLVDQLRLVRFEDLRALRKEGNELFAGPGARPDPSLGVAQGCLERANVNPVQTLARMITNFRAYEAAQRLITVQDESLQRAIDVARI